MSLNVIITGSSGGFGKLTTLSLLANGYRVFATMRGVDGKNKDAANTLGQEATDLPGQLSVVELDVTDQTSVQSAIESINSMVDRIDVLVNNAGVIGNSGPLEVTGVNQFQTIMNVNVFGAMRVTNAVLPTMRAQKSGLILQLSSTSASYNVPFSTGYIAAKAAIERIVEGYRYDLASFGIDCIILQPGAFGTSIMDKALGYSNPELVNEYASVIPVMEQMEEAYGQFSFDEQHSDPQIIASAIVDLIERPIGSRPFRTVVDSNTKHIVEPVNQLAEKTQQELLKQLGVLDELTLKKTDNN